MAHHRQNSCKAKPAFPRLPGYSFTGSSWRQHKIDDFLPCNCLSTGPRLHSIQPCQLCNRDGENTLGSMNAPAAATSCDPMSSAILHELRAEVERARSFYPATLQNQAWVRDTAFRWVDEITTRTKSINRSLQANGHNTLLTLDFIDSPSLDAMIMAFPADNSMPAAWHIRLSLAWFPKALRLANRLLFATNSNAPLVLATHLFHDWKPTDQCVGAI